MENTNELEKLGFALFDAFDKNNHAEIKNIYSKILTFANNEDYRKIAKKILVKYSNTKNDNSLPMWKTALFLSPSIERINEYLDALVNKE